MVMIKMGLGWNHFSQRNVSITKGKFSSWPCHTVSHWSLLCLFYQYHRNRQNFFSRVNLVFCSESDSEAC
jgi:hypothetical protein